MQDEMSVSESRGGKSPWNLFICYINICIFASTVRLALSSELFKGLDQNPANPGIGVNYYGKIQNTTLKTLGNGLSFNQILDDFIPRDCSKAPNGTSCVQRDIFYQDPDFIYTYENQVPCDFSYPYRHYNGTCISPHITVLGQANDCYFRFTAPYYDGFGGFRKSISGNPLPEPRDISLKIFKDFHRPEMNVSFQFLTFGQLIAHDVSKAIQPQTDCCAPENADKEECTPIRMRPDDPFYSQFNVTCMLFQRSELCPFGHLENREQRNGATAAIDASIIYGVNENEANQLRTLDGTGRLKSSDSSKFCLLPTGKSPDDIFCPKMKESECFIAGDYRVNQHALLTSLQTVFLREHNRLAKELKKMNPHWQEEKLFQEARKILIAELQCITYQDFLPILLSPRIMDEFDITIKKGPEGTLFVPLAVIAVWNDFAHAAFRLHSMIPTDIGSLNLRFKDTFSNPELLHKGHTVDLIKGSQYVPNEKHDRYMVKDLTDFLYQGSPRPLASGPPNKHYTAQNVPFGLDLAATNIQRGRDHGIAPYWEIVSFCTERTINITSFDELVEFGLMPEENVQLLKELYESVLDVDMWVGMQLENRMPGSILGPSAVCASAKQFFFSQKGDRLFFNHEGLLAPFTADQRSTIKNCSLGRILCDNTNIGQVPKNTFLLPSADNPVISCEKIPKVDLSFWKDGSAGSMS